MIAEFFGDLERLAATLYPYRWPIAIAMVALVAGLFVFGYRRGWHNTVRRHRLLFAVVGTPTLVLIGIAGYDLGSPLFTNVTVEEEFPFAHDANVPEGMKMEEVEAVMEVMAKMDQEFIEDIGVMDSTQATPTPTPTMAAPTPTPTPTTVPSPEPTPTPLATALALKTGSLRDQDSFHKGSGQATIFELPDGSRILRLENLKVTNGPELHVILTPHQDPNRQNDVKTSGYVDLGVLKGNIGNQNYPIPDEVDIGIQQSVVIYCKPFHVIFSVASLS